jgi:cytoskeletal protein CcmA (bactofilin family)
MLARCSRNDLRELFPDNQQGVRMFMKSPTPASNEPITRRDVKSFLPSATQPGQPSTSAQPPALAKASTETPANVDKAADTVLDARLIVGPDVKLKGAEILDCDTLVVEGRVEATMDSRVIRIADKGSFSGKVSIDVAEIHGSFDGELTARSQLIIHATGKVSGKIRYGKLVIDEGGELCGDINALSAESSSRARQFSDPPVLVNALAG